MGYHQDFINSIYKSALQSSQVYKLPVNIILAQACQESGWGQRTLGNTNNIFNIKADSSWNGKYEIHKVPEVINGKTVYVDAKFRVYDSIEDSIVDHAKFLSENPRYHGLFDNGLVSDIQAAEILQNSGYATDPKYAVNLQNVINGKTFKTTVSSAQSIYDNENSDTNPINNNQPVQDVEYSDQDLGKPEFTLGTLINSYEGGYGTIKEYIGYDGSVSYHVPNGNGVVNIITIDKEGNVTRNDFATNDDISLLLKADAEAQDYVNSIDISKLDKYADSGQIKSDVPSDIGGYDAENQTFYTKDENGNIQAKPLKLENNITIYGNPSNPDKITFSDEKGYQVWEKNEKGEFVQTNAPDYSQIANTAINQIGSLIIANNENFSSIEKIAVSTTVATIADFATYSDTKSFNTMDEGLKNLQGAVISFAISSFFAKNDNISDILGMDGTFVGGLADFVVMYTAGYYTTQVVSDFVTSLSTTTEAAADSAAGAAASTTTLAQAFEVGLGAAIGGYLGSTFANEIMDWDTKSEAMGASIGSALGTITAVLLMNPATFLIGLVVAFGGSFIGNIIGGIVGGLFGGKKPPPPTADATLEFDDETSTYKLISSHAANGGNEAAIKKIGENFAKQLENMFNLPGGQLVDCSRLPDIHVNQVKDTVTINGQKGSFSDVSQIIADLLTTHIPFINVENGDAYILRALNRTNENLIATNTETMQGRGDLEKLYENVGLAADYSKYKNEQTVLVDKNGNLITDKEALEKINQEYLNIQALTDDKAKEAALKAFLDTYTFMSEKEYVDTLLKENKPEKFEEINHWKQVFTLASELQLDTPHYSEDFNKLNTEIAKYNYETHAQNNELISLDYDAYIEQITEKVIKIYKSSGNLSTEENPEGISKDEAKVILVELGYDVSISGKRNNFANLTTTPDNQEVKITPDRIIELAKIVGLELPFDENHALQDAFSLKGKSLDDLQFSLENGTLIIRTYDKDLDTNEASASSQTFSISNWDKWDKTNTHLELPDGTKVNLKALLDVIGVKEGGEFVDVNDAFTQILAKDETIASYLDKYDANNVYVGTNANDTIKAYFGDNLIVTGNGKNTIVTGSGDDIVFAHNGTNTISTGLGNDTVSYERSDSAVYTSLSEGGLAGVAKGDTYTGVENLIGSKFNDVLEGNSENNTLVGKAGDDILVGKEGADVLDGGDGIDMASYETSQSVAVNLKQNYADGGEAAGDTFISIEGIKASNQADVIVGDDTANIIYANAGDDKVAANSGDDIIYAGSGNDYLKGDAGNDILYGEEGDDILIGGDGNDILSGGTGQNILMGDSGKDTVLYKGVSSDFDVMFINQDILLVKSKDGKILDTLKGIEEIAFDDVVFEIDYAAKTLVKKVVFENAQAKETEENLQEASKSSNIQAAAIATAIMVGTVASAQTPESSTDEMNYLSDDPASLKSLSNTTSESTIPVLLTKEHSLYEVVQKIKEYGNASNVLASDSAKNSEIISTPYQVEKAKSENNNNVSSQSSNSSETQNLTILAQTSDVTAIEISQTSVATPTSAATTDETLDPLVPPQITLNQIQIAEDHSLSGITIVNANSNSSLEVVFEGIPDSFLLSAGEKHVDGNWYLKQNDLLDLKIIPETNNANDFDVTIKAIVADSHGRISVTTLTQTIHIVAVADIPNLELEEKAVALEDKAIPLVISTSLVDTLGGADGEEHIVLSIENVPSTAILSAGVKDSDGIWYLKPEELVGLSITPKLHDATDFTLKVTAYAIESENNDIASISQDIHVEVYAKADNPTLEVSNSQGDEDTQIALNIKSALVDVDGSETLSIKIENVPDGASLNHGTKDADGIWHLLPHQLNNLTITPAINSADDFVLKVTAYTTEAENGDVAYTTHDIVVSVNAIADEVDLDTHQSMNNNSDVLIQASEDVSMMLLDISSTFIDNDGSEIVHYIVEGLPEGHRLNQGVEIATGTWKISVEETKGLGIFFKENSDEDFRLKISAVTTEAENGDQKITSKFIDVAVDAVADYANLTISNASGMQNNFIALNIASSLKDTDGSESLKIIIENIPNGAILNNGVKGTNGEWILTQSDLNGLSIRPPFNSSDDFELKVRAVTQESENGNTIETVGYVKVNVEALPSSANVTVTPLSTNEDVDCLLNIKVDKSNLHPSESIYLEITIPKGFSLNQGEQLQSGAWKITTDQLSGLTLKMIPNYAGSIVLDIVPVIVESNGEMRKSEIITKLPIDIEAVADEPTLNVSDIYANEDSLIYLNIASKLKDLDGSENLQLHLSGVPDNAILNAGKKVDGVWIVEEKDISTLALLAPQNEAGHFDITIQATSTDSNGDQKSVFDSMSITLNEVVDEPILNITNNFVKNNESYLSIHSALQDTDGSESLSIEITGVPTGAILSSGTKNANGDYVLTVDELTDLKVSGLGSDVVELTVRAISSAGAQSKSIEKVITLTPFDETENPYIEIHNLDITSETKNGEILEYSGANDTIKSGGGNDIIYSQGGDDIVYADEASGKITVSFTLNSVLAKTDGSERLVYYIENLPQGFTSNIGYVNDGKLVIDSESFDGKVTLSYPYTKEITQLSVVASAISTDPLDPYIKNTLLSLDISSKETAGNDYINAGTRNDIVYGQDGDDIILGGDGNDTLYGGSGNDYINGGNGSDKIDAGAGDDYIVMDAADFSSGSFIVESINAGDGYDTVMIQDSIGVTFDMGLTNVERFIGGSGNDNIIGSDNADVVHGGEGADTYYTLAGDDIVYIDAEDIQAKAGNFIDTGIGYDKIYIEDSRGVEFDVADTHAEEIISGSGNDILRNSSNTNVSIFGMEGNDTIYASSGTEVLDGGTGIDTLNYSNSNTGVSVNLSTNTASGGYAQNDIILNFENIVGTSQDDILTGNNSDNIFWGGAGHNIINGLGGEDTVVFQGSLLDYFNGVDKKNIVTSFDGNATVTSQNGINELSNINKLQFDDYTVYIDGRNNSPFVYNDTVNGKEDTALQIDSTTLLKNDFDLEGSDLKIVGVKNASNGNVVLNNDGSINFNPNANYNSSTNNTFDKNSALYKGKAGFEYIVEDSSGNQRTAYVEVNIAAVNDAPTLVGHYFNQNSMMTGHGRFTLSDIDSNVDNISVAVISSTLGYTNIAGRTADANGEFHFDYYGEHNIWFIETYSMRPFVVQISDDGEPSTGKNIGSIVVQTGIYYQYEVTDPIVIDLDGDGVEMGTYNYANYDNAALVGVWKDDAVLVWDKDQDGTISSLQETNWLGLSQTAKTDLDVLREIFDTNHDGIFDSSDDEWQNFALWQDTNMDGKVTDDEFTKISDSSILQLNLNENKDVAADYPILEYASYTSKEHEEHSIAAAHLGITLTEDKLSKVDIQILKEAIVLNEQLGTMVPYNNEGMIEMSNTLLEDEYDDKEHIA